MLFVLFGAGEFCWWFGLRCFGVGRWFAGWLFVLITWIDIVRVARVLVVVVDCLTVVAFWF